MKQQLIDDALELSSECPAPRLNFPPIDENHPLHRVRTSTPQDQPTIFVNPVSGDDKNSGSASEPLKTIAAAIAWSRDATRAAVPRTIMLQAGVHVLDSTVLLNGADSQLTITSDSGAVVSGGVSLGTLNWQPAGGKFSEHVLMATLPAGVIEQLGPVYQMKQLFVNDDRAVRARHPNANYGDYYRSGLFATPATGFFSSAHSWIRSPDKHADRTVNKPMLRNTTRYSDYTVGYGGPVEQFDPPAAYWAVDKPPAGGGCKYEVPVGLTFEDAQFAGATPPSEWTAPDSAIVHAFHRAHWGDWAFAVDAVDATNQKITWDRGGFQEARGSCGDGGHEWYIEGVKELLDAPNEWYFDDSAKTLYYYFNETSKAPSTTFVASKLATLFSINGTQANPVKGITITNLTFAHTRPTFMDAYEVPSAGDW